MTEAFLNRHTKDKNPSLKSVPKDQTLQHPLVPTASVGTLPSRGDYIMPIQVGEKKFEKYFETQTHFVTLFLCHFFNLVTQSLNHLFIPS